MTSLQRVMPRIWAWRGQESVSGANVSCGCQHVALIPYSDDEVAAQFLAQIVDVDFDSVALYFFAPAIEGFFKLGAVR